MSQQTVSPYLKDPGRLRDVIAAIQVMGTHQWSHSKFEDWAKRIGPVSSAPDWKTVFEEHHEFFRLDPDAPRASLCWRYAYYKTFDARRGIELTEAEIGKLTAAEKLDLGRKPLTADQIGTLLTTAIELHSRAIAEQQDRRWLSPLLFGVLGGVIGAAGAVIAALLKP